LLQSALKVQEEYPGLVIPENMRSSLALALKGLTLDEAGHVMHRILGGGSVAEKDVFNEIFAEKKMLLRKTGFLEFIPNRLDIDAIGGLEILKDWVAKRKDLFTQSAVSAGLPVPKGVLVMGISGCGKSMSAKAIASIWRVPLFRLDMNLVFSGLYGSPEIAFHRALRAIESIAPAVLWIDEIESALGMTSEQLTVEQSLTFSSFLTWMQERPPLVFVAATANRIERLPAEIIRKGRFDEVFFCDLPSDDERREIIRIHLKLNGIDPGTINIERLLLSTEGWSGSEIEQAIIAARIDALREGVPVTLDHIRYHTTRMVPLSTTMAEQIAAIKSWVFNRATRASREKPRTMMQGR
jgi:SpoVK/Ycf46/Vps4 family AAA+-type ATPase